MIALTISDLMDADMAVLRLSELRKRVCDHGVPEAICIRNDSFSDEPFATMSELIGTLWDGVLILETSDPSIASKALVRVMGRRPILLGATADNIDQFSMTATLFDGPLCVSAERLEDLMDLSAKASSLGVDNILLDPMMRNMKQCLEVCTDLQRLSERIPEADHPVMVRTWSGEYAMTMAAVSILSDDAVVVTDDLDEDSCETLGVLQESVR